MRKSVLLEAAEKVQPGARAVDGRLQHGPVHRGLVPGLPGLQRLGPARAVLELVPERRAVAREARRLTGSSPVFHRDPQRWCGSASLSAEFAVQLF